MKLKLIKGRSYCGHGVRVRREAPFVVVEDAQQIAALLSSGYFSEVPEDAKLPKPEPSARPVSTLDTKTKAELLEIAHERGVKLSGKETKAQLLDLLAATGPIDGEHTEAAPETDIFTDGLYTPEAD